MSEGWAIVTQVGFWGWLLATTGFILSGFPCRNEFRAGKACGWGVTAFFLFILWVVGMLNV